MIYVADKQYNNSRQKIQKIGNSIIRSILKINLSPSKKVYNFYFTPFNNLHE